MQDTVVLPLSDLDREWARHLGVESWGAECVVSRFRLAYPHRLPGFVAWKQDERVGLLTYHIEGRICEIVSLESLREGIGVGTALLDSACQAADEAGCHCLWLITTNDNLYALRFYQRNGFRLTAVHPGAVDEARRLKPQIPLTGFDGIPIRDEIVLVRIIS